MLDYLDLAGLAAIALVFAVPFIWRRVKKWSKRKL